MKYMIYLLAIIIFIDASVFSPQLNAQLADSPWPMFRYDARHTGQGSLIGPQLGILSWSYLIGSTIDSSPAVSSEGNIFVGGGFDSRVYSFNSIASLNWSYLAGDAIWSSPAIDIVGNIYIGSHDYRIYAFSSNGSFLWSFLTSHYVESSPVISSEGRIYIGSNGGRIYAISSSGSLTWSYQSGSWVDSSPAIGINGNIHVGSLDSRLYCLASIGSLFWSYRTSGSLSSSPAIDSANNTYIGSGGNLYALLAFTSIGSFNWSYIVGDSVWSSPAISNSNKIYVGSDDFNIYEFTSKGSLGWSYSTANCVDSSPSIGSNGDVFIGSRDHRVYALNSSGVFMWSYEVQSWIEECNPSIISEGTLCLGTDRLYVFSDQVPAPALEIIPSDLQAGKSFSFIIRLHQDINDRFDYYIVASTQFGMYTLYLDGRVEKGVEALYRNVPSFAAPFEITVIPSVIIPMTMGGKEVTFYTGVVQTGRNPGVPLSEISINSPYMILFDKKTVTVAP